MIDVVEREVILSVALLFSIFLGESHLIISIVLPVDPRALLLLISFTVLVSSSMGI
jgi:hypothetical protein